jgi:alcohol dehydrogenase (NADP+)
MDLAIVGCGTIATEYAAAIAAHDAVEVVATTDLDTERAQALAAAHDATAYPDLETLIEASSAPAVVNLTSHAAHAPVTRECLEADRHVYTEKPLALDAATASELVDLAADRGRSLGCAPFTLGGDAQQLAWRLLDDGRLGTLRWGYATCHIGRLTEWHDDPRSFLEAGPLFDGAVYPLAVLTAYLGPVECVENAHSTQLLAEHEHDGERFTVDTPDQTVAVLRFASGTQVQLTASAYVPYQTKEFNSIEFHGDEGSLYLRNCGDTDPPAETPSVEFARLGKEYLPVRVQSDPTPLDRASPLAAFASAVESGESLPPGLDPVRAAHTVAVIEAIQASATSDEPVPVSAGRFDRPEPPTAAKAAAPAGETPSLPPIGMGCSRYRDGTYVDRVDSIEDALDAGYRLLDMAELYGNEAAIGEVLARTGSPDRETLYLLGKVWNTNHRPQHVREACRGTLDRLGVDRLDCYMLHWPTAWEHQGHLGELKDRPVEEAEALTFPTDEDGKPLEADVSLAETWQAMEGLVEDGLADSLGISNVDRDQLDALREVAAVPPTVVQVESHPYQPRTALVEYCRDRGIEVVAAAPLSAEGLLSEPTLEAIAAEHGVSTAQVVLRWQIERDVVPIPSSTDRDHVVENADCFRFELSAAQRDRIDDLRDPAFERD